MLNYTDHTPADIDDPHGDVIEQLLANFTLVQLNRRRRLIKNGFIIIDFMGILDSFSSSLSMRISPICGPSS